MSQPVKYLICKLTLLIVVGFGSNCLQKTYPPEEISPQSQKGSKTQSIGNQQGIIPNEPLPIIRRFDLLEVSGIVNQGDPIVITNLQVIKGNDRQRFLRVEFENASSKPGSLIGFHLSYPHCLEFLYAGSLWLSYGDPKLVDPKDQTPIDPILNPGQKTIKIFKAKEVSKLLNPDTFHRCPPGKRTPVFVLVKVHFNDGTVWDPIGDLVEKIRSQSIQTKRP